MGDFGKSEECGDFGESGECDDSCSSGDSCEYSDSIESSDSDQHKAKIFQLNLDIVSKSIGVGAPELLDGIVFRILSLLVKCLSLQP